MSYLRDLWHFQSERNPSIFYDKYENLNSFFSKEEELSPEVLKNIQIRNLKELYKSKASISQLNRFLEQIQTLDMVKSENDLFARLVQGINEGLEGKKNPSFDTMSYKNNLENILQQLESIIKTITGNGAISAPKIDYLVKLLQNKDYKHFEIEKGDYLEQLGTWVVQQSGLTGFNTGPWMTMDEAFAETKANQIIEDIMGFSKETKLPNQMFNMRAKITGYDDLKQKGTKAAELQQQLNQLKAFENVKVNKGEFYFQVSPGTSIESFQQQLTDVTDKAHTASLSLTFFFEPALYTYLRKLGVTIQSKSNKERHLVNDNARSKYKMQLIDNEEDYYGSLMSFSTSTAIGRRKYKKDNKYALFLAYANYNLSKNIGKSIYARNDFYLTKEGFMDLATLMEKKNFYVRIADSALSYKQFLDNNFTTIYT